MVSVYHDRKDPRIVGITKTLESATTKKNEANKKYAEFTKNNYGYGTGVIVDKSKVISREERLNSIKAINAESNKLIDKMIYLKKETAYLQKTLNQEKSYSAEKVFEKAKLERKIKVNEYYQKYKECEKEYTEAPDAFVLRWND